MEKRDVLGRFVLLKSDFLDGAYGVDDKTPIKHHRPYLIVELTNGGKTHLFAIPTQTSVPDTMDSTFFEKLPHRLETRRGCDRGLLFGQMLPVTLQQIDGMKEADRFIAKDEETRQIIAENLWLRKSDSIPEKARASFEYLKKQARGHGISVFNDRQFQNSFKIVAEAIHRETIAVKNEKFAAITAKAQNYLDKHYIPFLRDKVYGKNPNSDVKMPRNFTRIDELIKYVKLYNSQHGSQAAGDIKKKVLNQAETEKKTVSDKKPAAGETAAKTQAGASEKGFVTIEPLLIYKQEKDRVLVKVSRQNTAAEEKEALWLPKPAVKLDREGRNVIEADQNIVLQKKLPLPANRSTNSRKP